MINLYTPNEQELIKLKKWCYLYNRDLSLLITAIQDSFVFEYELLKHFGIRVKKEECGCCLKLIYKGQELFVPNIDSAIKNFILSVRLND